MIYLFYGTNTIKSRRKLRVLLDGMLAKKPDASYVRIESWDSHENNLDELTGGQGLFENKYIVVFDTLFKDKDAKEFLLKNIKEISQSQNIFIFLEEVLNKTELKKFEKYAEKIQEFSDSSPIVKEKKFDIFSLTSALGKRDKKNLWVLYRKAKLCNVSDEEIHGILFWQIKSLLLSVHTKNTEESGLNPFVYRKSLGFVKNYSVNELKKLSNDLVSLYHDTRRGVHDMDTALERFILSI